MEAHRVGAATSIRRAAARRAACRDPVGTVLAWCARRAERPLIGLWLLAYTALLVVLLLVLLPSILARWGTAVALSKIRGKRT